MRAKSTERRRRKTWWFRFRCFIGGIRESFIEWFTTDVVLRSGQVIYAMIFICILIVIVYGLTDGFSHSIENNHPANQQLEPHIHP